jgi:hypothetical protein
MDFLSQRPNNSLKRIENEINVENIVVRRLDELAVKGFVLLYTTLMDQIVLDTANLSFPLSLLPTFSNPASSMEDKMEFVRIALRSVMQNNNFNLVEAQEVSADLNDGNKAFSIGFISMRRI